MSVICWNCRGFGNFRVVPKLKYLVRCYKPDALFLSETLVTQIKQANYENINEIYIIKYLMLL